jgi:hypothetical protein
MNLAYLEASSPVEIHEPPNIILCLPSKQGVEKSSYMYEVLNPGKPLKWSSHHSHVLPNTSLNPFIFEGYKSTGYLDF